MNISPASGVNASAGLRAVGAQLRWRAGLNISPASGVNASAGLRAVGAQLRWRAGLNISPASGVNASAGLRAVGAQLPLACQVEHFPAGYQDDPVARLSAARAGRTINSPVA
ncbi:hypothetical protein PYR66_05130 [Klebsiella aerogenes]|nr:hypothetical protein PYR66_05130 [Klebsiella aerogenes]